MKPNHLTHDDSFQDEAHRCIHRTRLVLFGKWCSSKGEISLKRLKLKEVIKVKEIYAVLFSSGHCGRCQYQ